MASLSRTKAEAVSTLLKGLTKPVIGTLVYDTNADFKVVNARPNIERHVLGQEVKTWVVIKDRIPHPTIATDTCGLKWAYQMQVVVAKRLNDQADDDTQPGTQIEMDSALEYTEWVQTQIGDNRTAGDANLIEFDIDVMSDEEWMANGITYSAFDLTYG